MKTLSLTQPWAWLVIHGGKDIENRPWNTAYRGRFMVHATKRMKASDFDAAWDTTRAINQNLAWRLLDERQSGSFLLGGIIGSVELVGVLQPHEEALFIERRRAWHLADQFGFVLCNPEPQPFQPCKGTRRWWHYEETP